MQIINIKVDNYRNLNLELLPAADVSVISGDNGKGKSNFIDTMYLLSHGKSMKSASFLDNLNWESEQDFSKIEVVYVSGDKSPHEEISAVYSKFGNSCRLKFLHNQKFKKKSKIIGLIKTIIFSPETLQVITGSPELRRREIDDFLELSFPDYADILMNYQKIVRNRNKILKKINEQRADERQLDYWTIELINEAEKIVNYRLEIFSQLSEYIDEVVKDIKLPKFDSMGLKYLSKFSTENSKDYQKELKFKIAANVQKEILLKRSLYGPHRDDFAISRNGQNLKEFGSRGQQRLAMFILKLAEWKYWENEFNVNGILLIDDIISELDPTNAKQVMDYLLGLGGQVFLTTANRNELSKDMKKKILYEL